MKGLILAAGGGTRLRPLTEARPKPLVPIAGKPLLQYNLENLRNAGIEEVVLVICAEDTQIPAYFGAGESLGMKLTYVPQRELLGTAHAVYQAREALGDSSFALTFGDNMTGYQIRHLLDAHREHGGEATLAVFEAGDPRRHAVITLEGEWVRKIVERPEVPESNLTSAGMFVLGPEIFGAIERIGPAPSGEYYLPHAIQLLLEDGARIGTGIVREWRRNVNTPDDMLFATRMILKDRPHEPREELAARLEPPVHLGEDIEAGRNSSLGPVATIGHGCRIGEGVLVRNSVLFDGVVVGSGCYLENCILGEGAIVANDLSIIGHDRPIIIADGCTVAG